MLRSTRDFEEFAADMGELFVSLFGEEYRPLLGLDFEGVEPFEYGGVDVKHASILSTAGTIKGRFDNDFLLERLREGQGNRFDEFVRWVRLMGVSDERELEDLRHGRGANSGD